MKKRIIATLLTAVMAFSLMACGGGSSASSSSNAAAGDAGAETAAADTGSGDAEYTIKIGHSDTTTNLIHVSLDLCRMPEGAYRYLLSFGMPSGVYTKVIPSTLICSKYCFSALGKDRSQYGAAITI